MVGELHGREKALGEEEQRKREELTREWEKKGWRELGKEIV